MDVRFNSLSQQIFNKPLEECSEHEIRCFVEQHPYFAPTQFLLLKKLDKDSEAYQAQFQKAILYYHDAFAFNFLVNAEEFDVDIEKAESEFTKLPIDQSEDILRSNDEVIITSNEEVIQELEKEIRHENLKEEKNYKLAQLNDSDPEQEARNKKDGNTDTIIDEKKESLTIVEQTAAPSEQLAFEPFHTVDYFASVGIKLSQEEATKDRMGLQLKSFTEWLKTMKRLQAPELDKKLGGNSELKVENMAADSVQNADVFTEAMAEVWIKQGNISKAMEVYNKLCLQNPSKSAYFAAKIDHLKEQI
jgi:hypothetical protein